MNNIPTEILLLIKSFVGCYIHNKNFYLVSRKNNSLNNCLITSYKSLLDCKVHSKNPHLVESIDKLRTSNKIYKVGISIDSLSFNSIESFNISRNYFTDFGNILYVCNQEKKIVYDYSGEYFYE